MIKACIVGDMYHTPTLKEMEYAASLLRNFNIKEVYRSKAKGPEDMFGLYLKRKSNVQVSTRPNYGLIPVEACKFLVAFQPLREGSPPHVFVEEFLKHNKGAVLHVSGFDFENLDNVLESMVIHHTVWPKSKMTA